MMVRIQQMKLPVRHTTEDVEREACRILNRTEKDCRKVTIVKQSIDARKKNDIHYIYTVDVETDNDRNLRRLLQRNPNISEPEDVIYAFPGAGAEKLKERPVIIGTGPAGLFCGLMLARHGYRPILLERGEQVEKREQIVQEFWDTGKLNPCTNVQFGEGGAGTFSDGKLNTLIKDNYGRNRKVLQTFVEAGAPESILYTNKAHIGTDVLRLVVKNIRREIEKNGGEVRFNSQVTDICDTVAENGERRLSGVIVNGREKLPCSVCVLAIGHSARDTFALLHERALEMKQKAFAVGVRMEHPQRLIDEAQYGRAEHPDLPVADYKVTYQASNGRSIYSFCMCPGGYVVNASSEEKRLAVNGMSYHDRAGENANSALIVSVTPKDFGSGHPLAGVDFQRRLEEAAYRAGDGKIPVQLFGDFCRNIASKELGEVMPKLKGGWQLANLREIFPNYISEALIEGVKSFGTKIKGFDRADAVMSGVESRTSSPVRIVRNEAFESSIRGIYPCGEGAGYAGGITSAAMDGIKVAEAIAKRYHA